MADEQDSIDVSEVFHNIKLEILEEKRDNLTRSLDAEKYLAHLRSKKILDRDDEQVIKSKVTGREKAETLLDMLTKGDPSAFDELCEALLKNKTQVHILQMLLDSFEEKIADSVVTEQNNMTTLPLTVHLPSPGEPGAPSVPGEISGGNVVVLPNVHPVSQASTHDATYPGPPNSPPPPYSPRPALP